MGEPLIKSLIMPSVSNPVSMPPGAAIPARAPQPQPASPAQPTQPAAARTS